MKEAPHEAGPEARKNSSYAEINIGLASPQYALAEPVVQPDLTLGNARAVWWNQSGDGIQNHVTLSEPPGAREQENEPNEYSTPAGEALESNPDHTNEAPGTDKKGVDLGRRS